MALARLDRLIAAVQRNCHIADARHARGMTLCAYLLEMREFYRWEHGLPPGAALARAEVGAWLTAREDLWATLENEEFADLPLEEARCAPFDAAAVNAWLLPHGLVYGAGIGRFGKPHFFLGRLRRITEEQGARLPGVIVCGCEYARDLTAIPAALQGDSIVVRQEALRQWLWEKVEAWSIKQPPGALQQALAAHGHAADPAAALERMTEAETESVILHERGEHAAGRRLGPQWEAMLAGFTQRRAELLARAVRDNWADCLVTLPRLIEQGAGASLHFWFANFDGMRREIFPLLAEAYRGWAERGDAGPLRAAVARGAGHWEAVAGDILARYRQQAEAVGAELDRRSHDLAAVAL